MSIWHPGSGLKWNQYLQANSFVKDITGEISQSAEATRTAISEQTRNIVASNEALESTLGAGFDAVEGTLTWGFNRISNIMEDIDASIEGLRADFNYNMGLVLQEIRIINRNFDSLLGKLDAIYKTLENPTLTQAREFYRIGGDRLEKRLLDKALESFIKAEEKNDTDFFIQFQLGMLFLYGIDEDDNVVDLIKAKKHLLDAARYAKAEIGVDDSFKKLAAEALFYASIANYALIDETKEIGGHYEIEPLLKEAIQLCFDSYNLFPELIESLYHLAKYSAQLNEKSDAIKYLEEAIAKDRNYALKVDIDHAFDPVRSEVFELLLRLKQDRENEFKSKIDRAEQLINDLEYWHPEESKELKNEYLSCTQHLIEARSSLQTYFDLLDAIPHLDYVLENSKDIKYKRISELNKQINNNLESARYNLPEKEKYSEKIDEKIDEIMNLILKCNDISKEQNYESLKVALEFAESALNKSKLLKNKADTIQHLRWKEERDREEEERERKRRIESAKVKAIQGLKIGAVLGSIGGCVSCLGSGMEVGHFPLGIFFGAIIFGGLFYLIGYYSGD